MDRRERNPILRIHTRSSRPPHVWDQDTPTQTVRKRKTVILSPDPWLLPVCLFPVCIRIPVHHLDTRSTPPVRSDVCSAGSACEAKTTKFGSRKQFWFVIYWNVTSVFWRISFNVSDITKADQIEKRSIVAFDSHHPSFRLKDISLTSVRCGRRNLMGWTLKRTLSFETRICKYVRSSVYSVCLAFAKKKSNRSLTSLFSSSELWGHVTWKLVTFS